MICVKCMQEGPTNKYCRNCGAVQGAETDDAETVEPKSTRTSQVVVSYNSRGDETYTIELWHDGLRRHRIIRSADRQVLRRKVELQASDWNDRWINVEARGNAGQARQLDRRRQEDQKLEATRRTNAAQGSIDQLSKLLEHTLAVDDTVDWERLKDTSAFPEPKPKVAKKPRVPPSPSFPLEPKQTDDSYQVQRGFLDWLFAARAVTQREVKFAKFRSDYDRWAETVKTLTEQHAAEMIAYESELEAKRRFDSEKLREWERRKEDFVAAQAASNAAIDEKRTAYLSGGTEAIVEYCDLVLSQSNYPESFPKEFELQYDPETRLLIVDYALPSPDDLPRVKAVKFISTRGEFEEQYLSDSQAAKMYDDVIYQVVLRTLHELFEADSILALDYIVLNGIVCGIDRTTGRESRTIIVSLKVSRAEFLSINLSQVDPKACFKALKGVGSAKLTGMCPIPPIMTLNREDSRFVSAYAVAGSLESSTNLAAIDWEDFEHLIREVFEREFSSTGGEVRVTQASRDGGVDAVAFDPDPIRGGKIVIQAKRYSNTVGVAAVRDLYGTVVNEGASKGILVTTSDFGPESYAFANNKPIVLISGSNLLHLLEKHGHSAHIDLREAKKRLADS
jgi:restriction system protein